jgi:hypothetical protein
LQKSQTYTVKVELLGLHLDPEAMKEPQALGQELMEAVVVHCEHNEHELVLLVDLMSLVTDAEKVAHKLDHVYAGLGERKRVVRILTQLIC